MIEFGKSADFFWRSPFAPFAADLGSDRPVTFTKDVAPILQEKCQECHRAGVHGADVAGDL